MPSKVQTQDNGPVSIAVSLHGMQRPGPSVEITSYMYALGVLVTVLEVKVSRHRFKIEMLEVSLDDNRHELEVLEVGLDLLLYQACAESPSARKK